MMQPHDVTPTAAGGQREPTKCAFRVHGMDCAEEVATLQRVVGPLVGGEEHLAFDILKGKMSVSAPRAIDAAVIQAAVAKAGMRAEPWIEEERAVAGRPGARNRRTVLTLASGCLTAAAFGLHAYEAGVVEALGREGAGVTHAIPLAARLLYGAAIVSGIWFIAPRAWFAARTLRPDMNLLMTVAVLGAIAIGEWFEAATVSFLFAVSLALEAWSVARARHAVEALLDLAPDTVRVLTPSGPVEMRAADVSVGSKFAVRPGDRIALDGRVVSGRSAVNQAPITGESVPVEKESGDEVFAGTINGQGALEVEATRKATDTTLARIIRLVEDASARRSPSEQWVARFARVYTPAVFAVAVVTFLAGGLLSGGAWSAWGYRALVLLVIGCPCALVISTPVSIVAGLAAAARHGVLIKGGGYLEAAGRIRALAMDKTGTLTAGHPAVSVIVPKGGHTEADVLAIAASMEHHSDHPLARAIVAEANARGVPRLTADDFAIVTGKGATARIGGMRYWLGSHRYLEELRQEGPAEHEELERLSSSGRSVVVLGDDHHVCGFIALADPVRPQSREAIRRLRDLGLEHVAMVTGDNAATAKVIAAETGVDAVHAEVLPEEKVAVVESLLQRYGAVGMIGDGINDAPALAVSTLGIAMGAAGSDAAIETADVALMADDIMRVPWLVQHSRRAARIIQQNIVASLAVKVLFVVLTMVGAASLWSAIVSDMGVSLAVIVNALRLLRA